MVGNLDRLMGLRIKNIRKWLGLSQTDFGALFGVTQEAVSAWEHGASPDPRALLEIAKHGRTSIEWILTGKEREQGKRPDVTKSIRIGDRPFPDGKRHQTTPLLRDSVISGPPKVIDEDDIAKYLLVPPILRRKNIYLMRMRDHSMTPIIKKEEIVAISEWVSDIGALKGLMVAAWLPKEGLTLRWLSIDWGHLVLYPQNPLYEPIFVEKSENIRFFRVVWWWGVQKTGGRGKAKSLGDHKDPKK